MTARAGATGRAGTGRDDAAQWGATPRREDTEKHHRWQYGRFTGTRTCERCGLLPLDASDAVTECPGRHETTGDTTC